MTDNGPLVDSFRRRVTTLRVSLTDHCNFRCVYCMPPEGLSLLDKARYLTRGELVRFVRVIAGLGVTHVRLTGGEPLLRRDIVDVVREVKHVAEVKEVSITTNGSRLAALAEPLRSAGLDRVNISLDSLDPERFAEVTLTPHYNRVYAGIEAALRTGFPLKINVVVLRKMPEQEIVQFAQLAVEHDIEVRFLEFMPLCGSGWQRDLVYPIADVRRLVEQRFDMEALPRGNRPAQTFAVVGKKGKIGFIASLSEPFCDTCARVRLTADGKLRTCLFRDHEVALAGLLKNGASDGDVARAIRAAVWNKPWGSEFADEPLGSGGGSERRVSGGPFIRSIGG